MPEPTLCPPSIKQHRCAHSHRLAWPGTLFRPLWHSSRNLLLLHPLPFWSFIAISSLFRPCTFVKLHSCTCSFIKVSTRACGTLRWSSCLQLLNAATLFKINKLNDKLLCLPRKIYIGQTVKAWFCFADCKTETNFAELQVMAIRQLQTEHFLITYILQKLKLNSFSFC